MREYGKSLCLILAWILSTGLISYIIKRIIKKGNPYLYIWIPLIISAYGSSYFLYSFKYFITFLIAPAIALLVSAFGSILCVSMAIHFPLIIITEKLDEFIWHNSQLSQSNIFRVWLETKGQSYIKKCFL